MACKRMHTTLDGNRITKTSQVIGSRVSLNSTCTMVSDRDDIDTFYLDNEDESVSFQSKYTEINTTMHAWADFESTIKNIDTINPDYFARKQKPNFNSSGTFQQVMDEMHVNTEFGNTKSPIFKHKLNNVPRIINASRMSSPVEEENETGEREEELKSEKESVQNEEVSRHKGPDNITKVFARRGWKMLKRQVNENVMEHKKQSTQMNWSVLQHTIKLMNNVDRQRQDLYERYGIQPTTLEDGTVICENRMLSDRARAQLYGRNKHGQEYRRPFSYQPPPVHLRSPSRVAYQNKSRYFSKNAPNLDHGKVRPLTAKC